MNIPTRTNWNSEPNRAFASNRHCRECGTKFYTIHSSDQKFCSADCENAVINRAAVAEITCEAMEFVNDVTTSDLQAIVEAEARKVTTNKLDIELIVNLVLTQIGFRA